MESNSYGCGSEAHFEHNKTCGYFWELTKVIQDTEYQCDFWGKTPVQFDMVYYVVQEWYYNEN